MIRKSRLKCQKCLRKDKYKVILISKFVYTKFTVAIDCSSLNIWYYH